MRRREIHGIDFSGAAKAGRKIWIASARVVRGRLTIDACRRAAGLPGTSAWARAHPLSLCGFA